jgi:hypothetical protein
MGKDQFGSSDKSRKISAKKIAKAKKKGCCSYVEAGKSLRRRKFRLAARYVRLDIKRRAGLA